MKTPRPHLPLAGVALALALAACGGEIEREHTATTVRGSYGDPPPYDPCPPGDAGADASDAGTPDGC